VCVCVCVCVCGFGGGEGVMYVIGCAHTTPGRYTYTHMHMNINQYVKIVMFCCLRTFEEDEERRGVGLHHQLCLCVCVCILFFWGEGRGEMPFIHIYRQVGFKSNTHSSIMHTFPLPAAYTYTHTQVIQPSIHLSRIYTTTPRHTLNTTTTTLTSTLSGWSGTGTASMMVTAAAGRDTSFSTVRWMTVWGHTYDEGKGVWLARCW